MKTMTIDQLVTAIDDGKTFTVKFIKRTNNEERVMNARRGVKKGVKNDEGTNGSHNRKALDKMHNVLTCYDMQKVDESKPVEESKGAFRRIALDALIHVKHHGEKYVMDHEKNLLIQVESLED